jgi:hypothetical protein
MHVAIVDSAVSVAAVTEIGGDALEVVAPELWWDRLRDLHDLPELVVSQGNGDHRASSSTGANAKTADYFAKRTARADFRAFDGLMRRRGGEAPQPGDEMPENYHKKKSARR